MTVRSSERRGVPGERSLDRVEILLVDDDDSWARVTGRLLESNREGFAVETANTLAASRQRFGDLDPDCVVCDYQLGDGTGLEMLDAVREVDPDRPFVLVTGRGSESVASEAIGRGVTDYIRKDHDDDAADLLASRIENAVRNYRTARALERERRSKNAVLDILTATTAEAELRRQFCTQLVEERGYACAWIGSDEGSAGPVPKAVAGAKGYVDAAIRADGGSDEDEPARLALAGDEPVVVAPIDDGGTGEGHGARTAAIDDWRAIAREHGFQAAIAAPIRHEGVRFGVLAVYADDIGLVGERERRAVGEFAAAVGYALRAAERKRSLLADTPVRIAVEITDPSVPAVGLAEGLPAGADLEIASAVSRDDGATTYAAYVAGAAEHEVEPAVDAVDGLALLASHERDRRLRCELLAEAPTPETILAGQGARFERTVVDDGLATVSLTVPDDGTIETIVDALEARYDEATVSTVWTDRSDRSRERSGDPMASLTVRQREVLRHAYHVGYYEQPRETSATELAEQLGVARATATQHLRTAERKTLGEVLTDERGE